MNGVPQSKRILLIDDDTELCELLSDYLVPEGFAVKTVHDPEEGVSEALTGDYSMVILDVMLPRVNGFDALRQIRKTSVIPVIMLTARGDEVDRIVGLELGADDYLPKPFNPRELLARLRAIGRRISQGEAGSSGQDGPKIIEVGDVTIDLSTRIVTRDNQEVVVTSAEFSLLTEFLQRAGEVLGRQELTEKVLGRQLAMFDRSIDVHVSSLRKKLGKKMGDVERIQSVRGIGYVYARVEKRSS